MSLDKFKSFGRAHVKKIITNSEVWLYTRVSSRDQELNRSLDSQKDEGHKYAITNAYNITLTFGATYESASGDFTRKEFTKLIETVRRAKKKPFAILIYTMSRFSRSGGGGISLAHELVDELGVHLIEVATGKNTMTEEGKLEIYSGLIRASQDNLDRLKVTVPGMIKMLENGHWLGNTPPGYVHYGPRVKDHSRFSPVQKVEKGPDAIFIRKAWEMKLTNMSDASIIKKLATMNYTIQAQTLSKLWRNPFYCGVSTNKLLNGRVVKGNWEKLVTEKEFFRVQEILNANRQGYKHDTANPFRPLTGFLLCEKCGGKMTGYEASGKGLHYYKCRKCNGETINANSSKFAKGTGAHEIFTSFLRSIELPSHLVGPYKAQLKLAYEKLFNEKGTDETVLSDQLEKLSKDLKSLQRKYALEGLEKNLYLEFKTELEEKITSIEQQLEKSSFKKSNLDKCLEISADISQNLSKYWASGGLMYKKKLQNLVFPGGIIIDVKNRVVRTKNVNMIFDLTKRQQGNWEVINEESHVNFSWDSLLVAESGVEPETSGL